MRFGDRWRDFTRLTWLLQRGAHRRLFFLDDLTVFGSKALS